MKILKHTLNIDGEVISDITASEIPLTEGQDWNAITREDLTKELSTNPILMVDGDTAETIADHINECTVLNTNQNILTYDGSDDLQFIYTLLN